MLILVKPRFASIRHAKKWKKRAQKQILRILCFSYKTGSIENFPLLLCLNTSFQTMLQSMGTRTIHFFRIPTFPLEFLWSKGALKFFFLPTSFFNNRQNKCFNDFVRRQDFFSQRPTLTMAFVGGSIFTWPLPSKRKFKDVLAVKYEEVDLMA